MSTKNEFKNKVIHCFILFQQERIEHDSLSLMPVKLSAVPGTLMPRCVNKDICCKTLRGLSNLIGVR